MKHPVPCHWIHRKCVGNTNGGSQDTRDARAHKLSLGEHGRHVHPKIICGPKDNLQVI